MQIEQRWVIPQTVLYLEQRIWKQKVLRRKERTWKIVKWDIALILTLERRMGKYSKDVKNRTCALFGALYYWYLPTVLLCSELIDKHWLAISTLYGVLSK